jgi:hypothetical protein
MKRQAGGTGLKHEFRRLFRGMDFVSRHPAGKRDTVEARRFAEIYQQLGLAGEFLALQCDHPAGWKRTREKKRVCEIRGEESIREVIAFPKNNRGMDLMSESQSNVDAKQLRELDIKLHPRS